MNYLAIDTSGAHLAVIAAKGEKVSVIYEENAGLQHSVRLMGAVERAMNEAGLTGRDADFFAAVVGPGSFTGIRIGVATVKALAYAFGKPVKSVTSFDTAAYHVGNAAKTLAVVDARHGSYYVCGYEGREVVIPPAFVPLAEAERLAERFEPVSVGPSSGLAARRADIPAGLAAAAESKPLLADPEQLVPLYIRKSQAEEGR